LSLSPAQRRRFVRHLLLPEIGPRGQARLLEARFTVRAADRGSAGEVAALYLARAGLSQAPADGTPIELDETDDPIDAALIGAWAAVEHVKRVLELGKSVPLAPNLDERSPRKSG
jgi:molybdopterin/thiamine biosynthesis adenylyltransferase